MENCCAACVAKNTFASSPAVTSIIWNGSTGRVHAGKGAMREPSPHPARLLKVAPRPTERVRHRAKNPPGSQKAAKDVCPGAVEGARNDSGEPVPANSARVCVSRFARSDLKTRRMDPLPDNVPPTEPPPNDGSGAATNVADAALAEKIDAVSATAIDQHLTESKKPKGRGKRGPDQRPRKPRGDSVPLGTVANGSGEPLLEDGPPAPLSPAWETPPPPFDAKAAGAIVDVGLRLLNKCAGSVVRAVALAETGDKALADDAAKAAVMEPEINDAVKLGAMQCAEKYAVKMEYAPEVMFLGGLGVWAVGIGAQIRELKIKGKELREQKPQVEEAA